MVRFTSAQHNHASNRLAVLSAQRWPALDVSDS
jgi:hypothetical protein